MSSQKRQAPLNQSTELDALLEQVTPDAARRLVGAAVNSFASIGYHATTTRDISTAAGMSPAALYVHFSSKEEILFLGSTIAHESALASVSNLIASTSDPAGRIRELVYRFTLWHAEHQVLARVAQYSLNELAPEHYEVVAEIRRRTERIIRNEIRRGVKAKDFDKVNVAGATWLITSVGIDVARWFRADERVKPEVLARTYADLVDRMLVGG